MVSFIGTQEIQRHLRKITVELAIQRMAGMIKEDYLRWHSFEKSARVAHHSAQGVIELMPISDGQLYACKYVTGHPKNTQINRLTVAAFGVLSDVATGYPRLLCELTLTTALRTAATSLLAAQAMARPASRSMALIGNGAQSEFQAIAFHCLMGIEELRVYDIDLAATAKLIHNLRDYPALRIIAATSTAAAVMGADIVTTVTADKSNALILLPGMISPGTHINAVGGDCPGKTELHADILRNAHVVVEYAPQTRLEGEIQQMPPDFAVTELWQVLAGLVAGRPHSQQHDHQHNHQHKQPHQQVTVFDSVGFALEDFSAMRYLEKYVLQKDPHTLDLIPALQNPKDLYGMKLGTAVTSPDSPAQAVSIQALPA